MRVSRTASRSLKASTIRPLPRHAVRAARLPGHALSISTSARFQFPRWLNKQAEEETDPEQEKEEADKKKEVEQPPAEAESKATTSGSPSTSSNSGQAAGSSDGGDDKKPPPTELQKPPVPEVYPQVLALPISRRPLFPGFYKAVVIRDKAVAAAIKEMLKRGQPYLGAFLLKQDDSEADVITDINAVHPVGVFAQITSTFTNTPNKDSKDGKDKDASQDLTVVLYPHRRIRITELLPPSPKQEKAAVHDIQAQAESEGVLPPAPSTPVVAPAVEDEATSFEPSAHPDADTPPPAPGTSTPPFQTSFLQDYAVSRVNVDNLITEPYKKSTNNVIKAVSSEIISVFKDIAQLNPLFRDQIANFSMSSGAQSVFDDPEKLADFSAAVSAGEPTELQDVLESLVIEDRMQKALLVLKKELLNAQLQSKISKDVENKIQKRNRDWYLHEQLKGIKKELGLESDGKDKMVEKFLEKVKTLNMPETVRKVFDEEISKLQHLEPAASEFNVTRNYLDWLTQIPWGRHSEENFGLAHARTVLDEDHYGLKDVKNRILEFLAVGKLRGTVQGKILCFVGPPGVGKTSIGKSIARALNRQFFRFSVGGLSDVAEMKGHRRTYVGAMPGKFIQALKKVATENPLVLIDEIDKLGRGINGDPASALLEALDPEQNHAYLDHYLDVPVDLSRVLFVCTANTLDTIPAPLLDRMEVLEVNGYVSEEKRAIASRYLQPQAKEDSGLKEADVTISDEAIDNLIRYYCRESGVRRLKQQIEKVYRKAALKIVEDLGEEAFPEPTEAELSSPAQESTDEARQTVLPQDGFPQTTTADAQKEATSGQPTTADEGVETTTKVRKPMAVPDTVHVTVTPESLIDYVGPPIYQKDRIYTHITPAGVSTGLGYLGNGSGSCLPVEATVMPGSGGTQLTGKLGEVIKESAQIAISFLRTHAYALGLTSSPTEDILDKKSVHLHMPEGSVGKEGPSAGTAILTALVSLFKGKGISSQLAMTGEMTLAGQVLAVGGVQEKLLAAQRSGIKTVVVPSACKADIEHNVSASVKEGMEILYAEDVRQALRTAFQDDPEFVKRIEALPISQRIER